MIRLFRITGLLAATAALAACATNDLIVGHLEVDPTQAPAGSVIEIRSEVRNVGDKAVYPSIDLGIYESATEFLPIKDFDGWADDVPLAPGQTQSDVTREAIPTTLAPGGYFVCGDADPENRVKESNEDNNRLCTPLTIVPGKPVSADLVVDKIIPGDFVEASRIVTVRIRNAGTATANGPFRIMAFRRAPRQPLLLIECALTEGQLSAGSPSSCNDLEFDGAIAPGVSKDLTGYFAYVVSNGAAFVRQPVKPGYKPPLVSRTIDFMVDGCFPPDDSRPVHCRIEEIDEINNFKEATFKSR